MVLPYRCRTLLLPLFLTVSHGFLIPSPRNCYPGRVQTRLELSDVGDAGVLKALDVIHKSTTFIREIDQGAGNRTDEEEEEEEEIEIEENDRLLKEDELEKSKSDAHSSNFNATHNHSNNTKIEELDHIFQAKLQAFNRRAQKTQIILLRKIASWAFEVSDTTQDGRLDRADFYSGTLLVHLHLAKYVGVAACQPPTREQVDELFTLADADQNNYLTKEEFTSAVLVATAPMTSRIAVYWTLMAILPFVIHQTMGGITQLLRNNLPSLVPTNVFRKGISVLQFALQLLLGQAFFAILVPTIFSRIDRMARLMALKQARERKGSTSLWWLPTTATNKLAELQDDSWTNWFRQVGDAWRDIRNNNWSGYTHRNNTTNKQSNNDDDNDGDGDNAEASSSKPNRKKGLMRRLFRKKEPPENEEANKEGNEEAKTQEELTTIYSMWYSLKTTLGL